MQKEKEKYSFWQRVGIYLYNILSNDINVRIHGVPANTVDTRYENTSYFINYTYSICYTYVYIHEEYINIYLFKVQRSAITKCR